MTPCVSTGCARQYRPRAQEQRGGEGEASEQSIGNTRTGIQKGETVGPGAGAL